MPGIYALVEQNFLFSFALSLTKEIRLYRFCKSYFHLTFKPKGQTEPEPGLLSRKEQYRASEVGLGPKEPNGISYSPFTIPYYLAVNYYSP